MNIRKPTDYTAMFAALDALMAAQLPQMELYCEIGRVVSGRSEKGAAVAASEYLQDTYPATEGFSPRNLRRMRAFYMAYEESPEITRLAMYLGWTRNVAILERCGSNEERTWYIRAVLHFGWKKAKLLAAIESQAWLHSSLDEQMVSCYKEIAFEFASWISVEFKLYLVKEFERLKAEEMKQLGWDIKRNLAKINYRIHTDAIKENLIPPELSARQISLVYANEADVLNMALFGMTAKEWRDANPDLKGNIRDYANVSQLVCLSNLENLNAVFINEGIPQTERLAKLNAIAISQMKVLTEDHRMLQFDEAKETKS